MRVPLDLHFDACPQVTIAAWIKATSGERGRRTIVSTGAGDGPGIRLLADSLVVNGPANGLIQRNVIRPGGDWIFVAGVWDYQADKYTLYWNSRKLEGTLRPDHKPPQEALWLGALDDTVGYPAQNLLVDEVRIIGSALTPDEIQKLRAGTIGVAGSIDQHGAIPRPNYDQGIVLDQPAANPVDEYGAIPRPSHDPGNVEYQPGQPEYGGSVTQPVAVPGDQYDPVLVPGDQYEPVAVPGDQYDPVLVPGDQYEPAAVPGDQYNPAVPPAEQ